MGYPVTEQFRVFGVFAYQRLLGDVADSPIVADAGDPEQMIIGLGIGYFY
jgi:outer membrane scaffolding protein for murein synthesis (MipA/OmpV family)